MNKNEGNMVTKAMLMAAGVGSRLEPLTKGTPKPLVPLLNKPMSDIIIDKLHHSGIDNVIANTYFLSEKIIRRYSNYSSSLHFEYVTEKELSGTAGGLKKCQYFFEKNEDFLVLSADGISDCDFNEIIKAHKKSNAIATITLKKVDKQEVFKFGVVVPDANGFVSEFQEKPSIELAKSNLINTGIYVFNYKIFDFIPENEFFDFAKNIFQTLMEKKIPINTYTIDCYWNDIGTIRQYIQSTKDGFSGLLKQENQIVNTITGSYIAHNTAKIASNVRFEGNCVIGKNCQIAENVILKNVILWDNVSVEKDIIIDDCVIANDCIIKSSITKKIIEENSIIEAELCK